METTLQQCPKCNEAASPTAAFCASCGTKLEPKPATTNAPNKTLFGVAAPELPAHALPLAAPAAEDSGPVSTQPMGSVESPVAVSQPVHDEQTEKNAGPPSSMPMPGEMGGDVSMDDPLASVASKLPQSKAGTLFGIPLSTLSDSALEKRALFIAGIALLVSLVLPIMTSPIVAFRWELQMTGRLIIWPLMVAVAYLFVAKAPDHLREKVPSLVLKWIPFVLALLSIGIVGWGPMSELMGMSGLSMGGSSLTLLRWGYPVLVFGLLIRLSRPNDAFARYIIGAGSVLCFPAAIAFLFGGMFSFSAGFIFGIHNILFGLVLILAAACFTLVPTERQVPQLRSAQAFAPFVTALLLAWIPIQVTLFALGMMVHFSLGLGAILIAIHLLVGVLAYFGILMLTAPEAYDEALRRFTKK